MMHVGTLAPIRAGVLFVYGQLPLGSFHGRSLPGLAQVAEQRCDGLCPSVVGRGSTKDDQPSWPLLPYVLSNGVAFIITKDCHPDITSFVHDNEIYAVSHELSGGVVQVRNQIAVAVDNFTSVLGKGYENLNRVHPKGVLVIGPVGALTQRQKDSFNQFRHSLYSLTIITFDELLNRLKLLFCGEGYEWDSKQSDVEDPFDSDDEYAMSDEPPF